MRRARSVLLLPALVLALAPMGRPDSTTEPAVRPRANAACPVEPSDGLRIPTRRMPAQAKSAPAMPDADWLSGVERELAAREYRASEVARGLQAPNRAQDLRTYFGADGIRIVDRVAPGEPELARMRLAGVGRGEALAAPGEARGTHAGARVELARDGVNEWYENAPRGLEQGFTISRQPAGEGPLVLELAVEGARVERAGADVVLACMGAGTRRLGYGALAAIDARGRSLVARLEPCERGLRIVTDDRDAAYPVTIDPLITGQYDTQLRFGQAAMQMGLRVTGAGDVNGDG